MITILVLTEHGKALKVFMEDFGFANNNLINFEGNTYGGSAIVYLDSNNNEVLDDQDYTFGYAYGNAVTNNVSGGIWERDENSFNGNFSGDALGVFEIVVELTFNGSVNNDIIFGSTEGDFLSTSGGSDSLMEEAEMIP